MARLTPDELRAMVQAMKDAGVSFLRDGELVIQLGPPAQPPPDHGSDGNELPDWPEGTGDVYQDPFSYRRGVPRLKREWTP